jgi:hypothetical protein
MDKIIEILGHFNKKDPFHFYTVSDMKLQIMKTKKLLNPKMEEGEERGEGEGSSGEDSGKGKEKAPKKKKIKGEKKWYTFVFSP